MTREIPIVGKHGGGVALVSDADYDRFAQYRWYLNKSAGTVWRRIVGSDGRTAGAVEMQCDVITAGSGQERDHINGNKLDNRRENLRACTHAQNQANKAGVWGASRYKGISREGNRWLAIIQVEKRRMRLGRYDLEDDAASAYDDAARQHFGEFAVLNFARNGERQVELRG